MPKVPRDNISPAMAVKPKQLSTLLRLGSGRRLQRLLLGLAVWGGRIRRHGVTIHTLVEKAYTAPKMV